MQRFKCVMTIQELKVKNEKREKNLPVYLYFGTILDVVVEPVRSTE